MADFSAWIGRSEVAEDIVTPRLVEGFRTTLAPFLAPAEVPLGLHWCLAPPMAPLAELGPDGHAATGGFLPPVPLPRRMWAGGMVEHISPLRLGDAVERRSTIADIAMKQGRTGPLCFVSVRHEFATARGVALRERHDLVYRDAAPASGTPAAELGVADLAWRVEATPVLLFRYSALTFNGHRIHYDQPYATAEEGYPGLVVHGPLQATLLLNAVATLLGRPPARFAYRATTPLFVGGAFTVEAARDGTGRVRSAAGAVTMTSTAG